MHSPTNRGGLRFFLIAISLLASRSTMACILWGTPLLVLGVAMHLWSKGYLHQDQEVTRGGPYRFVRHPFYLGNLLIDAGLVVMSGWWPLQVFFPFWWAAVYSKSMRREEKFLLNKFGERYVEFRRRVPAFFPCRRPAPDEGSRFSWTCVNIVRTEIPRAFRLLSYPLMFLLWNAFREAGVKFLDSEHSGNALVLGAFVLMNGLAIQLARMARGRQILPS
jgi:hypothetical protein